MASSMRSKLVNWGRKAKFEQLESRRMLDGDQFEPNDSFATATDLGAAGAIFQSGLSIHEAGNDDYYFFTAEADGLLDIVIGFSHAAGDVDLEVYDEDQNFITASTSIEDSELVTISAALGEDFYVRVFGYDGATNPIYDLEISPSTSGGPDIYEANDDFASAYDLGELGSFYDFELSIHEAFNDDYFQFSAVTSGDFDVSVYFSQSQGDLDLEVFDSAFTLIGSSASTSDFENVFFTGVQGETYYIRVFGYDGALNPNYELEVIGPNGSPDSYEANDDFASAYDLGSLGDYYASGLTIHESFNDDYFKFTALGSGDFDIGVYFLHTHGDLDLEVYDSAQTLLGLSESVEDFETVLFSAIQGETYYIRVFGYDGLTNTDYELEILGPGGVDSYESNDSFIQASMLGGLGYFEAPNLSIHESNNDDYFQFVAVTSGQYDVSVFFQNALGDIDLELYDRTEMLVGASAGTTDSETLLWNAVQGETYFIRVFGFNGAANTDYELVIVGPALLPDAYEANDAFASAYDLGLLGDFSANQLSIHESYNDDYFRFTAAATGDVDVSISFDNELGDVDLIVYDSSLNLIESSASTDNFEQVLFSVVQGETYYILVYGYSGAINPQYDLEIGEADPTDLVGDYNRDGFVNAADFVVWRDTVGSTINLVANGDDSNSVIDDADYEVWNANFGAPAEASASGAFAATLPSPQSKDSRNAELVFFGVSNPSPNGASLQRGARTADPATNSSSQIRMLALLDLLDSLPNHKPDADLPLWEFAVQSEGESAALEEVFASYFDSGSL